MMMVFSICDDRHVRAIGEILHDRLLGRLHRGHAALEEGDLGAELVARRPQRAAIVGDQGHGPLHAPDRLAELAVPSGRRREIGGQLDDALVERPARAGVIGGRHLHAIDLRAQRGHLIRQRSAALALRGQRALRLMPGVGVVVARRGRAPAGAVERGDLGAQHRHGVGERSRPAGTASPTRTRSTARRWRSGRGPRRHARGPHRARRRGSRWSPVADRAPGCSR